MVTDHSLWLLSKITLPVAVHILLGGYPNKRGNHHLHLKGFLEEGDHANGIKGISHIYASYHEWH